MIGRINILKRVPGSWRYQCTASRRFAANSRGRERLGYNISDGKIRGRRRKDEVQSREQGLRGRKEGKGREEKKLNKGRKKEQLFFFPQGSAHEREPKRSSQLPEMEKRFGG